MSGPTRITFPDDGEIARVSATLPQSVSYYSNRPDSGQSVISF
jgi:hypothetical protein